MPTEELHRLAGQIAGDIAAASDRVQIDLAPREFGTVFFVGESIVRVRGLPSVRTMELVRLPGNTFGMAFNLEVDAVSIVMLDRASGIEAGDEVRRTGRVLDVPVGEELLGRTVDPLGRPLDGKGALSTAETRPIERRAPEIMDRAPVTEPLQTGLQVIDALIPVGRGQRELIVGDRQTGKTAIAVDTMINQRDKGVYCIYCAVGQRTSAVAKVVSDLQEHGARDNCIVVVASGEDAPGLNFAAPYAAMAMAEYFRDRGDDVLLVIDDITRHARAYRELSLLLRRPPAREAYPGDIFYIHSRLLERATHLRDEFGGGSLTALPIVETQAQNISAYIPTNLVSITDGQIYLSPALFQQGILPAVDVGKSVSRVGGKTQLPAYRSVAGDLRLSYSQFEELEAFARFGTRLDEDTRKTLERGRRVREVLKQPRYQPLPVAEQLAVLAAVTGGAFDDVPVERLGEAKPRVRDAVERERPGLRDKIQEGEKLEDDDIDAIVRAARPAIDELKEKQGDEDASGAQEADQEHRGSRRGSQDDEGSGGREHSTV
jgi:F-type H+-transporting ATPase subunit alpha